MVKYKKDETGNINVPQYPVGLFVDRKMQQGKEGSHELK